MSQPVKAHQAQTGLQPLYIPLCLVPPSLLAQTTTLHAHVAFPPRPAVVRAACSGLPRPEAG
jgi:hypothetical protein